MEIMAILVAAGRGERLGGARPKAFVPVADKPLLRWAAEAFDRAPAIEQLVAVVPTDEIDTARALLAGLETPCQIVPGGARRQDSVRAGLAVAPEGFDGLVLVHDAARPFVDTPVIDAVIAGARSTGAALPVVPVVDTIKHVADGHVVRTLERAVLFGAQTPQGFSYRLLIAAYAAADAAGLTVTDEAMALEHAGHTVRAVPGTARNRKITTPEDLAWAEALVAQGGAS
jgi:2-C-methyl-D-erythritol 4-phosphate cytidylyltransferase/2-C-methyl-D-erythritol 2,4-cyclodiphosphate synthase